MKEFKGTPGPWIKGSWSVIGLGGRRVMFGCLTLSGRTDAEVIANDNLVLSAPELLSALQGMLEINSLNDAGKLSRFKAANVAIAKALGESQ